MMQRRILSAALLAFLLIGCSNTDFPTSEIFPVASIEQLDASAGTWTTMVPGFPAPNTFMVPAPAATSSAAYLAELQQVKDNQMSLSDEQKALIRTWSGGGALRWNEIMRGLAARFALPPAPAEDGTYPVPSNITPAADPQFPFANPPYTTRAYSYMCIAQFEALKVAWFFKFQYGRKSPAMNDPAVQSLVPIGDLPSYPSEDAVSSAVCANITTLMFPVAASEIAQHAADQQRFAMLSGKATASDIAAGVTLGQAVAQIFRTRAAGDGFRAAGGNPTAIQAQIDRVVLSGNDFWVSQETPPRPGQLPLFGNTRPWMFANTAALQAIRPPPPPATSSPEFRNEVAMVKNAVENITRGQLATVYKWADGVGTYAPSGHWNLIASRYVRTAGFSEVRNARAFALLNAAEMDAVIGCWDAKFFYYLPRPSQVDPSIKTLTGLPNFPAYTSGHSTFSTAAATVLGHLFPAGTRFFDAEAEEASLSRFYGGIHYKIDIEEGKKHGAAIGGVTVAFAQADGAG